MSFTGAGPPIARQGAGALARFRNFRANGVGTFSANSAVPEPMTLALGAMGVPFGLVLFRRRSRAAG